MDAKERSVSVERSPSPEDKYLTPEERQHKLVSKCVFFWERGEVTMCNTASKKSMGLKKLNNAQESLVL